MNIVEYDTSRKKYHLTETGHLLGEVNWDIRFLTERKLDFMRQPTRYVRHLGFGDHSILFYDTEDIKSEIAYSFLLAGLLKDEAVAYVVAEHKLDSESQNIREYGINVSDYGKAFEMLSSEEWYLRKGKARAETIIANWQSLIEKKRKAGFTGLYVAAEMEAFLNYADKELLRYEEMIHRQFPSNFCAFCLYDTKKLDEKKFIQLNQSHGHSVFKGIAVKTKQA